MYNIGGTILNLIIVAEKKFLLIFYFFVSIFPDFRLNLKFFWLFGKIFGTLHINLSHYWNRLISKTLSFWFNIFVCLLPWYGGFVFSLICDWITKHSKQNSYHKTKIDFLFFSFHLHSEPPKIKPNHSIIKQN